MTSGPRGVRVRRLFRHAESGLLITPLDHTLAAGPVTTPQQSLDDLVADLAAGGSDAIVVHKGAVRTIRPERLTHLSLIVHLNGSTGSAPDPDAKTMLTGVEEAVRLGADAVSIHVNLGSDTEAVQLADLARTGEQCDRWNMPLLVMIYPRGPRVLDPYDPELVTRAVVIGADLGADLVKTVQLPDLAQMRDVVRQCPVPVLVAGGPPREESLMLRDVSHAMAAGTAGVAMGRCLFGAADPRRTTAKVAALVHGRPGLISTRPPQKEADHHADNQAVLA